MALKKLTLSIDEEVIESARRYTTKHKTSVSRLVTQFLARLPGGRSGSYSPAVQRLLGILPSKADVAEYHRHLSHKHRR